MHYLTYTPTMSYPEPRERDEPFTLEELQKIVGGYIQVIPAGPGRVAVTDEEGKLKANPVRNNAATSDLREYLFPGDYIVNTCLVISVELMEGLV